MRIMHANLQGLYIIKDWFVASSTGIAYNQGLVRGEFLSSTGIRYNKGLERGEFLSSTGIRYNKGLVRGEF